MPDGAGCAGCGEWRRPGVRLRVRRGGRFPIVGGLRVQNAAVDGRRCPDELGSGAIRAPVSARGLVLVLDS